jgi:hypothetical protein
VFSRSIKKSKSSCKLPRQAQRLARIEFIAIAIDLSSSATFLVPGCAEAISGCSCSFETPAINWAPRNYGVERNLSTGQYPARRPIIQCCQSRSTCCNTPTCSFATMEMETKEKSQPIPQRCASWCAEAPSLTASACEQPQPSLPESRPLTTKRSLLLLHRDRYVYLPLI